MWSKKDNKKTYFTEIYTQNFEYIYGYIFARTAGNRELTEEIVQETFAAAWSAIDRFNGKSTYATWLCSIAKNKLRESYRKTIYREKLELSDRDKLEEYADHFDLEKMVIDNETRLYVLEVLESMNPLYRYALIMKYIDGMSVKEISKVLGKTSKAIDGVLQRAKITFAKGYLSLEMKRNDENNE
ncbi:RNA polymerase sigma factor [Fusibacter ferrireducens]|uniref:RNA polymerase sigma factor n=1 Tax=Fusibacter ferrireducens TaxID=2785058 RepID=A0ABR9ZRD0_9FIRM|nr:RNA polymerase sigma factor [Fusibacter ferrireducens]MBF4692490.1 RNA polymerase sigma factor [Fusibacter ferrireducens]